MSPDEGHWYSLEERLFRAETIAARQFVQLLRYLIAVGGVTAVRANSGSVGGHFVFASPHVSGSDVYIYGMGQYRVGCLSVQGSGGPTWSSLER